MTRLLRLLTSTCLFAIIATVLLGSRVALAQFFPADPPSSCPTSSCPTCPPNGCVQRETYLDSSISLTEANSGQQFTGVQVRSGFGVTLDLTTSYNTDNADGSRNMFTKVPGVIDTVIGDGWTHTYNDLLFTQHGGDMFRLAPDGRITRFALQSTAPTRHHPDTLRRWSRTATGPSISPPSIRPTITTNRPQYAVSWWSWAGHAAHQHHRPQQQHHQLSPTVRRAT